MTTDVSKQLTANYNGVPFHVNSQSGKFGNRAVLHPFPFRNEVWVDNLGNLVAPLQVSAFVVDGKSSARDQYLALKAEIEKIGTGIYEHPEIGRINVQPGKCAWRVSKRELGKVSLDLEFLPPGENDAVVSSQTDVIVGDAADIASSSLGGQLEKALDVGNANLLERARSITNSGLDRLRSINTKINTALAPLAQITQTIENTGNELSTLLMQPRAFVSQITGLLGSVLGVADSVSDAMDSYRNFSAVWGDVDTVPQTTPTRVQEAKNQQVLVDTFTTAVTIEAVKRITQMSRQSNITSNAQSPFDSYDEAITVRNELISALDTAALTATAEVYESITTLITEFAVHIDNHGIRLPKRDDVSYQQDLPALVIAHQIYGDAKNVDDIVNRNQIANPLRVVAGTRLEVLRNA